MYSGEKLAENIQPILEPLGKWNQLNNTNFKALFEAIEREQEIKNLAREKKLHLIKEMNPNLEFWNYHFEIAFPKYSNTRDC